MRQEIIVESKEEKELLSGLEKRTDPESERLKRFLKMPDLSRKEESPIHELVKRILAIPDFQDFDVIKDPEIVPVKESFDLFNFPADHPARSHSDTYYLNDNYILRTHTTIMWYYYLTLPEIRGRVKKGETLGLLSYGKVYRKDEIDRNHMNVFHQMDGLYICKRSEQELGVKELQDILIKIAQSIFGSNIKYRFNKDTFPYTDPSLEMEIEIDGRWVEVLGSGVAHSSVLDNLGVDSKIYNGWAFGFGLERLAILSMNLPDIRLLWSEDDRVKRQLKLGTHFKEVSKFPPITRDISFVVKNDFAPNDYFDLIRDLGGNLVEEVSLLDKYENAEKFGGDKISYTYRIIYRSNERTLTIDEIEPVQDKVIEETKKQFDADVR
ncbi:MAG: hypothetical protein G01um101420_712 [Parcubacteria group bacterium Gr01-1014_20]|nr:MAG: hypothetical protein G01um101420_712 [Parcubacteria group bacterium Gr01-1014_20]